MMRRYARQHETIAAQRIAGTEETLYSFAQPGDHVRTIDGPGVVADVYPGPVAGGESYFIVLDDGRGEGEYGGDQVSEIIPDEFTVQARRYSQTPMACDVCGAPASKSRSGGRQGHTMLCPDCITERDRQKDALQVSSAHEPDREDRRGRGVDPVRAGGAVASRHGGVLPDRGADPGVRRRLTAARLTVTITKSAHADYMNLQANDRSQVLKGIKAYQRTDSGDTTKIKGATPPTFRLRIGKIRVLFLRDGNHITIFKIGYRGDLGWNEASLKTAGTDEEMAAAYAEESAQAWGDIFGGMFAEPEVELKLDGMRKARSFTIRSHRESGGWYLTSNPDGWGIIVYPDGKAKVLATGKRVMSYQVERDGKSLRLPKVILDQIRATKTASSREVEMRTAARAALPLLAPDELKAQGAHTAADDSGLRILPPVLRPTLGSAVGHVVGVGAEAQVVGVHAAPVVAGVHDFQVARVIDEDHVGQSVRRDQSRAGGQVGAVPGFAVASTVTSPSPFPASTPDLVRDRDRSHEADAHRTGGRSHVAEHTGARAPLPLMTPEELRSQGLRTAADDYGQLGEILWERPDLVEAEPVQGMPRRMMLGSKTYPTDTGGQIDRVKAAEIMYGTGSPQHLKAVEKYGPKTAAVNEPVWLKERRSNPIKDSLNDKNQPWWWRKVVGPSLDRYNDAVPPNRQIKDYDDIHKVDTDSWCRFRRRGECYFPKDFDEQGSEEAGYAVWIPYNRGECPWKSWDAQKHQCKVSEPGPKSNEVVMYPDATVSWSQGGQRTSSITETPVSITRKAESSWVDVREKAKRIRQSGGVRIISSLDNSCTGEVRGDTGLYTATVTTVPGSNQVALATCSCPWETYRWARSGPWKKLEGRACAHITALLYEMQARKMFGGEITEDVAAPEWRTEQPALENPKSKPGPWRLDVAASVQTHLASVTAQRDSLEARAAVHVHLDPQVLSLGLAVANLADDEGGEGALVSVARVLEARTLIDVPPFYAQVSGEIVVVDGFDEEGTPWANGRPLNRRQIMYPTFHPTRGLQRGGAKKTAAHSGVMVALVPSAEVAATISLAAAEAPGVTPEPAEEIHLTLAYCGKAVDIDRAAFMGAVQGIAAAAGSLSGTTSGWGSFDNETEKVLWSSVDVPGLDVLRMMVVEGLAAAGVPVATNHGFTPHITAGYAEEPISAFPETNVAGQPLMFDCLVAAYAGEWTYFDLSDPAGEPVMGETKTAKTAEYAPGAEGLQAVLDASEDAELTHAGLVIKAADSGRVLMTQRTPYHADDDETYGSWEFPGGAINEGGETAFQAAMREFREETGLELPENHRFEGASKNGTYLAIMVTVPNESWTTGVKLLPLETMGIGWFDPEHVEESPLTRPEVDDADWEMIKDASIDVEAEAEAILHDEPEPALPEALGSLDGMDVALFGSEIHTLNTMSPRSRPEDMFEEEVTPEVDPVGIQNLGGVDSRVAWLMDEPAQGGDNDIALAAQAVLAKMALKTFSIEEQHELIHEGAEDNRGARNTDRLSIEGTHYEYEAAASGGELDTELLW